MVPQAPRIFSDIPQDASRRRGRRWPAAALLLLLVPAVGAPANRAAEERLSALLREELRDAEALRLQAADQGFLAIYRRADTATRRGAVVLLHGRDGHADAPAVVRPLAIGLAEAGWDTLAVQLPVVDAPGPTSVGEGLIAEALPRIDAALAFLTEQGSDTLILVGHDRGAQTVVRFLAAETPPPAVKAAVLIGLEGPPPGEPLPLREQLQAIERPLLDLYGERDLASVLAGAPQRRLAARDARNPDYTQLALAGADHWFTGLDALLVSRVRAWLHRSAAE